MLLEKFKQVLFEAPLIRLLIQITSNVLTAFFSGTLVYEITLSGKLDWNALYHASSTYCILFVVSLTAWYSKITYQLDTDILKFGDIDYCTAYMRSKCLPEAAEQYKQAIRTGNKDALANAKSELKRLLK